MADKRLNNIVNILVNEIQPKKLILFGSRCKGVEEYNSDYDIAIDSNEITRTEKRKLKEKLENILGLHKIDLIFLSEVDKDFIKIIENSGRTIYEK